MCVVLLVEWGRDRDGGARYSAHVPRSAASPPRISSLTSLRSTLHRPDQGTHESPKQQAVHG